MGWSAGIWSSSSGSIPRRFARTGGAYRLDIADPAAGDLDGPYLQRVSIDTQMDFAPPLGECLHSPAGQRLAWLRWAMFLGEPLALTLGLDPGAVNQEV